MGTPGGPSQGGTAQTDNKAQAGSGPRNGNPCHRRTFIFPAALKEGLNHNQFRNITEFSHYLFIFR